MKIARYDTMRSRRSSVVVTVFQLTRSTTSCSVLLFPSSLKSAFTFGVVRRFQPIDDFKDRQRSRTYVKTHVPRPHALKSRCRWITMIHRRVKDTVKWSDWRFRSVCHRPADCTCHSTTRLTIRSNGVGSIVAHCVRRPYSGNITCWSGSWVEQEIRLSLANATVASPTVYWQDPIK